MNVQAEKLQLIEWLVKVQDVDIIQQLQEVKRKFNQKAYEESLKPMSVEELERRALESMQAIEAGEVVDIKEVLQEEWTEV